MSGVLGYVLPAAKKTNWRLHFILLSQATSEPPSWFHPSPNLCQGCHYPCTSFCNLLSRESIRLFILSLWSQFMFRAIVRDHISLFSSVPQKCENMEILRKIAVFAVAAASLMKESCSRAINSIEVFNPDLILRQQIGIFQFFFIPWPTFLGFQLCQCERSNNSVWPNCVTNICN